MTIGDGREVIRTMTEDRREGIHMATMSRREEGEMIEIGTETGITMMSRRGVVSEETSRRE